MPDIPLPKPQLPSLPNNNQSAGAKPTPQKGTIPPGAAAPVTPPPSVPSSVGAPPRPPVPTSMPPAPAPVSPTKVPVTNAAPPKAPVPGSAVPKPGSAAAKTNTGKKESPQLTSPQAQMASASSGGLMKFLPFIIGGVVLLVIGIIAMLVLGGGNNSTPVTIDPAGLNGTSGTGSSDTSGRQTVTGVKTTLNYWGLWEKSEVMDEVFNDFEAANPGVEVVYTKQSHTEYRQRLQTAIASGNGPDLFRFHASWTPMLSEELAAMPSKVMTAAEYQKTFYPVAARQLQNEGQIVGIPLMYDGLALYYNKEALATAGEEPPKTWAELKTLASKLTIRSGGEIKRAGLAVGNASTTEHFSDILGLLMLQNGADPTDVTSKEAQEALVFYTNFVTKDKVWNDKLPTSTVAFARGDVAMMFAPSWRAHEVLAMNPDLSFGIVGVPTLGGQKLAWASYWAEGVSSKSQNKDISWELLKYLSSAEVMQKMYSTQAETRAFGEIYSRMDLADSLASDSYVTAFLSDAPYAYGWHMSSYTHDKGINDNLIKYYTDAVNAILNGKDVEDVVETLDLGSRQVLRQYGVE